MGGAYRVAQACRAELEFPSSARVCVQSQGHGCLQGRHRPCPWSWRNTGLWTLVLCCRRACSMALWDSLHLRLQGVKWVRGPAALRLEAPTLLRPVAVTRKLVVACLLFPSGRC